MRITLRQLEIFIAIAQTGSTTAAAKKIALSQSAASASIAELEHALEIQFFDRIGKKLRLNDHGRALLPRAISLVDAAESLQEAFLTEQPSLLVLGASLTIGNYLLPQLLAKFWQEQGRRPRDAMPPIQVMIGNTAEVAAKVADFEVDIGLIEGPCHRPDVAVMAWLEDELVIVAAPHHEIAREYGKKLVPTARLAEANWLLREPGSGTREALEQAFLPHLSQLKSSLEFNDHEAIKQSAIHGLGVACLSRLVVSDMLEAGKLVVLKTAVGQLQRRFSLIVHRQKQMTPGMRAFIAHAEQVRLS